MTSKSKLVRTIKALRSRVAEWKSERLKVALVPTMGALHEGHLSLVRLAKKKADRVIVSIFVNPTQFGANEDLSKYPRTEKQDRIKLDGLGTDLVFIPGVDQMYPQGFSTTVNVTGLTEVLCGGSRPTHFSGVTTIVTKLLMQAMPDIAIFGEKDYQQLLVIRKFVTDLNIPVKIEGGSIVREKDGLAMSSRNAYLSTKDRNIAPNLYKTLRDLSRSLPASTDINQSVEDARQTLTAFGFKVDYLEVLDAKTLQPANGRITSSARIFAAAFLGKTRLIDNVKVTAKKSPA